ncbi:hypothetical protein PVL30_004634 [Lodderomyces elongisporus]|uniref:uncharacterized protein n=1 Tax=Lodderomyces elongisporus TaxID=36914 RepID=UPI00292567C5|nr:uncharacterized protein PVL30_004634 [Lodderomyces elongisporus]WLF80844.1 hypothetical protein PVL30_004634 [Lodderomyces elongisporus]
MNSTFQGVKKPPYQKRSRVSLSCVNCKKRKIKCSRTNPCESCIKYRLPCEYQTPVWNVAPPHSENGGQKNVQQQFGVHRIDKPIAHQSRGNNSGSNNQSASNLSSSENSLQEQLNLLKSKLREIESSIERGGADGGGDDGSDVKGNSSGSNIGSSISSSTTTTTASTTTTSGISVGVVGGGSSNYGMNSSRTSSFTLSSSEPVHRPTLYWESLDATNNQTYIGINPFDESKNETMSFFDGYCAVYEQDIARRYNNGPFSWITIVKKDPAQNAIWKHLRAMNTEQKRLIRQTPRTSKLPPALIDRLSAKTNAGNSNDDLLRGGGMLGVKRQCNLNEDEFREKVIDEQGLNDLRVYGNVRTNFKQSNSRRGCTGKNGGQRRSKSPEEEENSAGKIHCVNAINGEGIESCSSNTTTTTTATTTTNNNNDNNNNNGVGNNGTSGSLPRPSSSPIRHAGAHRRNNIEEELCLIECVRQSLPKQRVVWTSIEFFFKYLYPYMPILDENTFTAEMERMLGKKNFMDIAFQELRIEKRLDFAFLAVLMVLLRMTYNSLISNKRGLNDANMEEREEGKDKKKTRGHANGDEQEDSNADDESSRLNGKFADDLRYLLLNPVDIKIIDTAQSCLDQFDLYKRTSLVVLQALFLLKLYKMFSPEDGDGSDGGDSQVLNGLSVQMAISIGLNRDVEKCRDTSEGYATQNLHRKIWFFLIICDLLQGYQYGNPLVINEKMYDTKLPFFKHGNENINDSEKERYVTGTFAYFEKYREKLVTMLDDCLNLRKPVEMKNLTRQLGDFEMFLNDNYGTMSHILVPYDQNKFPYPFLKLMQCKNYMNMKMFLNIIYYHIFLFYENKVRNSNDNNGLVDKSLALFYLKKMFASFFSEFFPTIFSLLLDGQKNFGLGITTDMILNPYTQHMVHKVSQFSISIMLRLQSTIFMLKSNADYHNLSLRNSVSYKLRFAKLMKLLRLIEKISEVCISAMARLSRRYYYAWRVTKAHTFLVKSIAMNEDYHKAIPKEDHVEFLECSDEQLTEFCRICEEGLKKYTKAKSQFNVDGSGEFEEFESICGLKKHPHKPAAVNTPIGVTGERPVTPNTGAEELFRPRTIHMHDLTENNGEGSMESNSTASVFTEEEQKQKHKQKQKQKQKSPRSSHQQDLEQVLSHPLSNESWSDLDDMKFVNNEEIDNLWISMKMKNEPVMTPRSAIGLGGVGAGNSGPLTSTITGNNNNIHNNTYTNSSYNNNTTRYAIFENSAPTTSAVPTIATPAAVNGHHYPASLTPLLNAVPSPQAPIDGTSCAIGDGSGSFQNNYGDENGDDNNNNNGSTNNNGGEAFNYWKTLDDFDLFNALPLEDILGLNKFS